MSELIEKQVIIDWLKYKWNRNADSLFYGIQGLPTTDIDLSGYSDKLWKAAYERGKKDAQMEMPEWVQKIEQMYNEALTMSYIQKPLAWALYQVWKEYNAERRTDE